jgi:hypothetical protein
MSDTNGIEVTEIKLVKNEREDYPDGTGYSFSQSHFTVQLPENCTIDQAIQVLEAVKTWPSPA